MLWNNLEPPSEEESSLDSDWNIKDNYDDKNEVVNG